MSVDRGNPEVAVGAVRSHFDPTRTRTPYAGMMRQLGRQILQSFLCRVLDISENCAQARYRLLWGLRVVGVWEAIPFQEFAPSFGGGQPYACTEVDEFSARRISFAAHSTIFAESESVTAVYILTRGSAALYKMLGDGRKQIVGFALPGDFLGSPFVERYSCSVDAIGEVTARRFSREPFLTFLRSHPKHLCLMLEAALQEINAAHDHMLLLGRGTAKEKVVEFIVRWRARAGRKGALANLVPLPMSRSDIADFLGLTIETVSRTITKLERENVLRVTSEGLQLMGSPERPLLFQKSHQA